MKRKVSIFLSFLMVCTLFGASFKTNATQANTTDKLSDGVKLGEVYQNTMASNITVQAASLYKASSSGMPKNTIQSFFINGSDIYICQQFENISFNGSDYTENNILLSRCALDERRTFLIEDSMLLRNVGDGQTLDMYTYGGTTYFLVSCGAKADSDNIWSTEIGRITYCPNTVLENSDIERLTDLTYSNDENVSFGEISRVEAALSTDNTKLLLWKCSQSGSNQFSVYDFDVINQQLSSSADNAVSFQNNTALKNACDATVTDPVNMPTRIQGVELSDAVDGVHSIYITSGNEAEDIPLMITRYDTNGNFKKQVIFDDTGVFGIYNRGEYKNEIAEIKSIKLEGDRFQILLQDTRTPSRQVIAQLNVNKLN